MSDEISNAKRWHASQLIYPDIFLPEQLAQAIAERAHEAGSTTNDLIVRSIERFIDEHADQADSLAPLARDHQVNLDAPDVVRRIVPLPEELAHTLTQLADIANVPANGLIVAALHAAIHGGK